MASAAAADFCVITCAPAAAACAAAASAAGISRQKNELGDGDEREAEEDRRFSAV